MTPQERLEKLKELKRLRDLQAARQPVPERDWKDKLQDFGEGIAVSGLDTYYGIKDLAGKMTDEDRATLEDWKERAGESGWGTGGRIVGELGQFAIPGGAIAKASKLSKAAKLAGELGTIGAQEYVRLPEEDETRGGNARFGMAAGLGGAVAGRLLKPLVGKSVIPLKPEAEELIAAGGYVTPGRATSSRFFRGLETVMEVTPFTAKGAKREQAKALRVFAKVAAKDSVPEGYAGQITGEGFDAVKQAQKLYDDLYDQAWGTLKQRASVAVPRGWRDALTKKQERQLDNILDEINSVLPGSSAKKIDDILGDNIRRLSKDIKAYDLRKTLEMLRNEYRAYLPQESQELLAQLSAKWPQFKALRRAAKNAQGKEELLPKDFLQGVKAVGSEHDLALGTAPGQRLANIAQATIGQKVEGQPLQFFRRLAGMFPSPPMRTVGKFGTGQFQWQRSLARRLRKPEEYLEFWADPARVGAAIEE